MNKRCISTVVVSVHMGFFLVGCVGVGAQKVKVDGYQGRSSATAAVATQVGNPLQEVDEVDRGLLQSIAGWAGRRGAAGCVSKAESLGGFLGAGREGSSALLYFDEKPGKAEQLSAVVTAPHVQGSHFAVMDVAQGDGCEASYEVVQTWVDSCDQVVAKVYATYAYKAQLGAGVRVFEGTPNRHVFVWGLPGSGCLTIQKEVRL